MLKAFRPLRYSIQAIGGLSLVVAPPYDVISEAERDALYERSEWNSVRLILNRDDDRYGASAKLLKQWRDTAILQRENEPVLCYYIENFEVGGVAYERTGLIGRVQLEAFAQGSIRPHEKTFARAKQDRMKVLQACRTNLSSIFGLVSASPDIFAPAREDALRRPPDMDLQQDNGWRHRVWLITAADVIDELARSFRSETVFIADGHHRYETALEYRELRRAGGEKDPEAGFNFVMMYLTSMHDPGLVVLPTHRVVRPGAGLDPQALLAQLCEHFDVRSFRSFEADRFRAALHQAPRGSAFGLAAAASDERLVVTLSDRALLDRYAGPIAPAVQRLDVTLLDAVVLRGLAGLDPAVAERSGHLVYMHDDAEALASVDRDGNTAFLLAPPRLEDVEAVCLSGETMPQKSTYFFPKLLTGLVFNPLDD